MRSKNKNLFDLGYDYFVHTYVIDGLYLCSNSTSFPLLPIPMQQRVQKVITSHKKQRKDIYTAWTDDINILDEFLRYLQKTTTVPSTTSVEFVRAVSEFINKLEVESNKCIREVIRGNLTIPPIKDPVCSPQRKRAE